MNIDNKYDFMYNQCMHQIIKNYRSVCIALAQLFPNHIEVVLHDLSTEKIIHIENAFSHRVTGDESLINKDELLHDASSAGVIGPYKKVNADGTILKSVSVLIKDNDDIPIAMMCMNFKTEQINAAVSLLKDLVAFPMEPQPHGSLISEDWKEQVNGVIRSTLKAQQTTMLKAKRCTKLKILQTLDEAQIFSIRGSSNYVSSALGISRANFYEILRDVRKKH